MLVPLQTSGRKPPLFFVHGLRGITFAVGPNFAHALGPDQPLYVINANGMDGRQPVIDDVDEMATTYFGEIQRAWPTGPLRVGGMCTGCIIAVEIARRLQQIGRQTGSVILADPPPVPPGYNKLRNSEDPSNPPVAERLYRETRGRFLEKAARAYDDLPFDPDDPDQLHAAIVAGVATLVAFAKYVPTAYSGPIETIISIERASPFFHPLSPWGDLLPVPQVVYVLPWPHMELFGAGRKTVARLMRSMLEEEPTSERRIERAAQPAPLIRQAV
jgi:thioesterase domain-containing protein